MYGHKWWLCWKISVQCGRELNFLHSDITVIIWHGQILILYNWRPYLSNTPRSLSLYSPFFLSLSPLYKVRTFLAAHLFPVTPSICFTLGLLHPKANSRYFHRTHSDTRALFALLQTCSKARPMKTGWWSHHILQCDEFLRRLPALSVESRHNRVKSCIWTQIHTPRPVFTHGPPGSGSRAANFQGRHIKKNRDWSMVCGKNKAVHEREI